MLSLAGTLKGTLFILLLILIELSIKIKHNFYTGFELNKSCIYERFLILARASFNPGTNNLLKLNCNNSLPTLSLTSKPKPGQRAETYAD